MKSGLFSETPNDVDRYVAPVEIIHGHTKNVRQFSTPKISPITNPKIKLLFENEQYIDGFRITNKNEKIKKKGFLTKEGFKYSSPGKESYSGDYHGSFVFQPYVHMDDGLYSDKEKSKISHKEKITAPTQKDFVPSQTKKPFFTDIKYESSSYDAEHQQVLEWRKEDDKTLKAKGAPFVIKKSHRGIEDPVTFAPNRVKGRDTQTISNRPHSAGAGMTMHRNLSGSERRLMLAERLEQTAFRPTSAVNTTDVRGPMSGLFGIPLYMSEPFNEKKHLAATTCDRRLPKTLQSTKVADNTQLRGRKVWTPTSPAKVLRGQSLHSEAV